MQAACYPFTIPMELPNQASGEVSATKAPVKRTRSRSSKPVPRKKPKSKPVKLTHSQLVKASHNLLAGCDLSHVSPLLCAFLKKEGPRFDLFAHQHTNLVPASLISKEMREAAEYKIWLRTRNIQGTLKFADDMINSERALTLSYVNQKGKVYEVLARPVVVGVSIEVVTLSGQSVRCPNRMTLVYNPEQEAFVCAATQYQLVHTVDVYKSVFNVLMVSLKQAYESLYLSLDPEMIHALVRPFLYS